MEYTLDRLHRQAREAILATGLANHEHIELVAPKPNIPADVAMPVFKAARDRQVPPPQPVSLSCVCMCECVCERKHLRRLARERQHS